MELALELPALDLYPLDGEHAGAHGHVQGLPGQDQRAAHGAASGEDGMDPA